MESGKTLPRYLRNGPTTDDSVRYRLKVPGRGPGVHADAVCVVLVTSVRPECRSCTKLITVSNASLPVYGTVFARPPFDNMSIQNFSTE